MFSSPVGAAVAVPVATTPGAVGPATVTAPETCTSPAWAVPLSAANESPAAATPATTQRRADETPVLEPMNLDMTPASIVASGAPRITRPQSSENSGVPVLAAPDPCRSFTGRGCCGTGGSRLRFPSHVSRGRDPGAFEGGHAREGRSHGRLHPDDQDQ